MVSNQPFKLLLPIFLLCFYCLQSQNDLALGQWRSYLPYANANYVTQGPSNVYFATEWSILMIPKFGTEFRRVSKVDGLSDVGISVIKYNPFSDILIIVYNNAVIDLVSATDGITALFDIQNFTGLTGDKEIYDIFVEDASTVYIAANYGISKLNLTNKEFSFTTFTGVPVRNVHVYDGHIYAAADDGLYRISQTNAFPEDFNQWERMEDGDFPLEYSASSLVEYNDQLYMALNDTIFTFQNEALEFFYHEEDFAVPFMTAEGTRLLVGMECKLEDCDGKVYYFDEEGNQEEDPNCVSRPKYAVEDEKGLIWFADGFREFRRDQPELTTCYTFKVNSPFSHNINEIKIYNNEVWVASGGFRTNFSYLNRGDGVFSYIDGRWEAYNSSNVDEMKELNDFLDIAINPETGVVHFASFLDGMVMYDRESFMVFNDTTSSLNNAELDPTRTRVTGLAFDSELNLWHSNHKADRPISVMKADGSWQSFDPSCNENEFFQVAVDQNDYKWFVVASNSYGLLVFDEGEMDDTTDDQCRLLSTNNSRLPTNRVNCVAVDLDGDVWVGTEQGTIVFECGLSVFEPECQGSLRIVEQDNFGAYLLETENVRTIAIDGANRKWFGTENGIFVQSPDGEEQVAFFDVNNSPLFDNVVNDIEINPQTGEVFIGTNKGLQSVKGEAIEGGIVNSSEALVYPNPVRPDYSGPIAIKGLARDADVKITDVNGQLVYETTALGGQAIWDGNDYNGRRASTGVYLVISTSTQRPDTPEAIVAKILFIR
jgi:hypothetical protein